MKCTAMAPVLLLGLFSITSCGESGDFVVDDFTAPTKINEPLDITPKSVTLAIGESAVFIVSGGSNCNYTWSVEPQSVFEMVKLFCNRVRVTYIHRSGANSGRVNVSGLDSKDTAIVYFE